MTAHDGLGSVRADRRKDAAERTRPEPRGVDVAEGRRLREAMLRGWSGRAASEWASWVNTNLDALMADAEERQAVLAVVIEQRDVARSEIAAMQANIKALADVLDAAAKKLLSPEDQS